MSQSLKDPRGDGRSARSTAPVVSAQPELEAILGLLGDKLPATEQEFLRALHSDVSIVSEMGSYIGQSGGKRIRPALLLLAARMCGYRGDRDVLLGAVFELIHTATLVHDDIIDEATLRRGRSSVNTRWGNHLTVLLGDYLYIRSMSAALQADDIRLIRVLADITLKMIEGELIQAHADGTLEMSEERHLDIVRRKTAFLFGGCCRIGAMLAGVDEERQWAMEQYGVNLGMAFQLVDDLLDFTADEQVLGKPVLSDLKEGKLTLPLIYLLQEAGAEAREPIAAVLRERGFRSEHKEQILDLVRRHGTLERARARARAFAETSRKHLELFEDGPERQTLFDIPDYILRRDH
ncbi:MAG: polyprenyl synthetase family protein [Acidobacteriota bacterium]